MNHPRGSSHCGPSSERHRVEHSLIPSREGVAVYGGAGQTGTHSTATHPCNGGRGGESEGSAEASPELSGDAPWASGSRKEQVEGEEMKKVRSERV